MQAITHDNDSVLCACDLDALVRHVETLEQTHAVRILKQPAVCLTMIRAEDSLEQQGFYLGEALTTECEVEVDGAIGYGLCLGEEPVRAYCIAVCDALLHGEEGPRAAPSALDAFLAHQREIVEQRDREEFHHVLRSQVDFKLMEQD
ncbi:hypothetical protein ASA1KI_35540 [Opitutales bacterium ASA1]|uniref:phosphonate C-P lyase system protein PhnG n=1 Tax=Congregicoccus parvus TaxID=3081749 RepID=UPI002B30F67C|nr:hypothetical protein ASA1KI_35540 [Opitutales bacterium ASA1]